MSANTAELTLIIKAQNLADAAMADVKNSLGGISTKAGVVASDMAAAFKGMGRRIANAMGNLVTDIFSGGNVQTSLISLGALMAGAVVEGMAAHLIPGIIAKVMATAAFAPLAAAVAGEGTILGGILATAMAVGAAALPVLLLAVAVGALIYLIQNPQARQKAREVALMIIGRIGDGLRSLPGILAGIFSIAFSRVLGIARTIVAKIVSVILSIPDAIRRAIASINLLPGLPRSGLPDIRPHASGGWVGLHGPELSVLGERGPEYVVPNHRLGDMGATGGFTIQGISEREIVEMVDRGLYFKLQRTVPTIGRT